MPKILELERLQKVIANAGYCSRRKAEQLILKGSVKINGVICTTLGTRVTNDDIITIDGRKIEFERLLYFLFYKPINCLTTLSDPKQRPTVMDYFSKVKERIYPIGRPDFDTSGLLLMTNDGAFSYAIAHPKFKIKKVYQVTCQGKLSDFQINLLQQGVRIEQDFVTSPAQVTVLHYDDKNQTLINLTIAEGHKNQVKKMLIAVGSKVLVLKRIAIGHLTLGELKPGQYRTLQTNEITALFNLSEGRLD